MVDDDRELFQILQQYLALEGFDLTGVHEGQGGVHAALTGDYALVLLDVMLPNLNGFEVLRQIRSAASPRARVPVLMLTARGDAVDRIVGLEVGADDYLPKPFNERELVARMRAILRRSPVGENVAAPTTAPAEDNRLRVDDVCLDNDERRVWCEESEIELTAVEFDLLAMLMNAAGHVVARRDIARQVLDRPLSPFDRSIDTHMSNLRRKLGAHQTSGERIKTVRGVGYIYTRSR